jgi:hypothetical protein
MKAMEKKNKEEYEHMDIEKLEETIKKIEDDKKHNLPLSPGEKSFAKRLLSRYASLLVKIWVSHS